MSQNPVPRMSWLIFPDGTRVRLTPRGLLLGRRFDCDVVLDDPRASSVQALILLSPDGPEVHAMGRNPTRLNGETVNRRAALKNGDLVEMPGARLHVASSGGRQRIIWTIERSWLEGGPRGEAHRVSPPRDAGEARGADSSYGIRTSPMIVGGGPDDDLFVPGWPESAVRLHTAQGALVADFDADGRLAGDAVEAGSIEMLQDGDSITFGTVTVRLRARIAGGAKATVVLGASGLPVAARFEFLPNGGTLRLTFGDGQRANVDLAEMRARMVASLLDPPGGYSAGDFVPDEVLLSRIWPGQPQRGRTDLNLLIHRTRKDLLQAGVNPGPVLARARMGLATCFRLAPGATVEVV